MPLAPTNGTRLYYDVGGPDGAPVVVFSNSIGTTLEMWTRRLGRWRGAIGCCATTRGGTVARLSATVP